jgi:archaeal flagellin FlaB
VLSLKNPIDDNGFTGLEGAIILIAFVIIASVFSFIVLGSGFFATGKAEDVIYTGVDQSVSSLMLIGDVYGYKASDRNAVDMLRFTVSPSVGGGKPMDLSGCSLTYATSERILTLQPNDTLISTTPPLPGRWTISDITSDGDSPVIRFNERATIMVRIPESYLALPGERITVTLIPPVGTAVTVSRTVPGKIHDVTILV